MSANHDPVGDEQLDQHVAALRDEPIEAGPSPQALQATLKMLRQSNRMTIGRRTFIERLAAMTMTQKIAATVMITLGGMTLWVMFEIFGALSPGVAFGDVVERLKSIRTAAYTMTVTLPGKPPTSMRTLELGNGRTRTEIGEGGIVISNGSLSLALDPRTHTATRIELSREVPRPSEPNVVESFRQLAGAQGKAVGERLIDGVETRGFLVMGGRGAGAQGGPTMTIWADKKTALPVRVETTMPGAVGETLVVLDHFELDPILNEALFSTDVPPGYQRATTQRVDVPKFTSPEDSVIELLRAYAEANAGLFPASLTDSNIIARLCPKPGDQSSVMKASTRAAAVYGVVLALGDKCGYAGKDVRFGEKDRIVFWYRLNPKLPTYRAVFGDLHVADVAPGQLPSTQPAR
jgi:outer membrane lipoprotein-sorting protein